MKEILAALAIALTLVAFVPYFFSILRNQTKPHVFSWVIWGVTTLIVFFAQFSAQGGVGTWPIAISGLLTLMVAVLAFIKRGDVSISLLDWTFFLLAVFALPLWFMTSNPMWSVVVLTVVDILGFAPTARKVYNLPHSESAAFYALFMLRNLMVIGALESYSITTALFPSAVATACAAMIVLILMRRLLVEKNKKKPSASVPDLRF